MAEPRRLPIARLKTKVDSEAYAPNDRGTCRREFGSDEHAFEAAVVAGTPGVLMVAKQPKAHAHQTFVPWSSIASVWLEDPPADRGRATPPTPPAS